MKCFCIVSPSLSPNIVTGEKDPTSTSDCLNQLCQRILRAPLPLSESKEHVADAGDV